MSIATTTFQSRRKPAAPRPSFSMAGLSGLLQRKCACGSPAASLTGHCDKCKSKGRLQAKLTIGASNDQLEQEADRIADQVLAAGANPAAGHMPPHTQRYAAEPATEQADAIPLSVAHVLGSPGSPLGLELRQDMEQRFGHDFSQVRVHTSTEAEQSARDVNAHAYTVGHNVVFAPGQFAPGAREGRRLIAHELTHVVQQSGSGGARVGQSNKIGLPPISYLRGVPHRAIRALQRQAAPGAHGCPTLINFSADDPVHVPSCGPFRAHTDVGGVAWSLVPDPTAVAPGTNIAANGAIIIAANQAAGQIKAVAAAPPGCFVERPFQIRSNPTGITSTHMVSMSPNPANDYGAVFDHTFISADGNVASLENVAVGERFIGVPNPTGAAHAITAPTYPFGGTFQLQTATLTANASNNWFLTAAGQLGGTHDIVFISRASINVGRFMLSASNASPPQGLPATITLTQGLHWFCPQALAANRWRTPAFATVAHSRTLRNKGGNVEFVTTLNGLEVVETYSGPLAVFNLTASPASTPRSPAPPPAPAAPPGPGAPAAPAARTVRITVDSLPTAIPAGQIISFSLIGNALGCVVAADPANDHAAVLTIGQNAGIVTVEAADSSGVNRARVRVVIT
jgi:hypothetical protein